jgi:hypothetical protein
MRGRTFKQIVSKVAANNARTLEAKARAANWLAHSNPQQAKRLFEVKCHLISQLFTISQFEPVIQGCTTTRRGLVLSIKLTASWGQLHVPLNRLSPRAHYYVLNPRARQTRSWAAAFPPKLPRQRTRRRSRSLPKQSGSSANPVAARKISFMCRNHF